MNWTPYLVSLAVGVAVGVLYGLLNVRSPAPPIVALLGLLGIVMGEGAIGYLRGHAGAMAEITHVKNFAEHHRKSERPDGA